MVVVIDNFDSFTYNLVQYLQVAGQSVRVFRNDATFDLAGASHVVISPGPGSPADSGSSLAIAKMAIAGNLGIPLLGVCLGHQAIGYVAGIEVGFAGEVRHGKQSPIAHDGDGIFTGLPSPFQVVRYHSLSLKSAPPGFIVSARAEDDGEIMGIRHSTLPIEGVQFHPESILTEHGQAMISNFVHHRSSTSKKVAFRVQF
ncbi:MAG: aminodeoxychorismate/anthranilate synthase component II [Fimbriimonadaceae bacterium]|nr:aminodeoxychorismate/anthranilate synthase component II [Fimbriimonadaceae bacterium]